MTSTVKVSPRDRLLDAAAELFYRDGVNIGVDTLCKAAGVSKRSMYQLFDSKDEVLAASLARSAPRYEALFVPPADDSRPPRARILHVFERLAESSESADYRGCPFVATAVELKDPAHPASVIARTAKNALTAYFRTEAEQGGACDPETLARQLTLIFDGASARAVVQAEALGDLATVTATALLDAGGVA